MKHVLMIEVIIGFIFLIISDTNAGFVNSVSKKLKKLVRPKIRSINVQPLQKDLEKDDNPKTEEEFELALATERLGFVYCNVRLQPFMGRFVKEYLNISEGHSSIVQTLVPRRVTRAAIQNVIKACNNFLLDEVLRDNGLRLAAMDEDFELVQAVERVVQFDYFSAKPYKFAVLQCPVRVDNGIDTKIKKIFFSALGKTEDENTMDDEKKGNDEKKKNVDGVGRSYYVFADYTELDRSKFKILMRTVQQDPKKILAINSPPRSERTWSRIIDNPQRCPIRLHVKPKRFKDGFRLFGKDAEAAFLTETFRFFNKSYSPNKINRFLDTALEMKKGYDILSYYEWLSQFTTDLSGYLSGPSQAISFDCRKYVKGAKLLRKYRPSFQPDDNINWVDRVSLKIRLKITEKSLERVFYQCPVTFAGEEHSGKAKVNVLPITYRSTENCEDHAFYYVIVNENTSKDHRDTFFSRIEEPEESPEDVRPVKPVRPRRHVKPVTLDESSKGVETDESVEPHSEPTGGFIPVEGVESVEPDGVAKSVRGVKLAGDYKLAGVLKPVRAIEPAQRVKHSSSDLTGSIQGEQYSQDDGDDADVSEISESIIGVSGELEINATRNNQK